MPSRGRLHYHLHAKIKVMKATRARRHVVVVDNSALAKAVGGRIRRARQAAGLTQRELAGDRYTPAYISALETGSAKPSMAALHYVAERLSVDVRSLVGTDGGLARRAEADLHLAAGDYTKAADAYQALLETSIPPRERPLILLGLAETMCRLDRGREALALASEAQDRLRALNRPVEAALAGYWLAAAQFQVDNSAESKALLVQILSEIRAGLRVSSDFLMRVLVALAMNESADGEHERALTYLEEARGLESDMDDLRRARYLYNLAVEYQETGDAEAALRAGAQSEILFAAAESDREIAALENLTALIHVDMGNAERAGSALAKARELAGAMPGDERFAASMADTQARIYLAQGRSADAETSARTAIELAERAGVQRTVVAAQLTLAQALQHQDRGGEALASLRAAAEAARKRGGKAILRRALGAYAKALTAIGRHEEAAEIYQEALGV